MPDAPQTMSAEPLHDLRRRVLAREEYTKEELRDAVFTLVGDRIAQAQASAAASNKRSTRSRKIDLDEFL